MIALEKFSWGELQQLQFQLTREINDRRSEEKQKVVEEFAAFAKAKGFSIDEFILVQPAMHAAPKHCSSVSKRRPARLKYRHPEIADQTWTGRGKTPRWIRAWLDAGGSISDLAIDAEYSSFPE